MKRYAVGSFLGGLICLSAFAFADQEFDAAQTEALLGTLTGSPRRYWIDSGTITARHLEYRRPDDYFAQSTETLAFDGQQFRWEITLDPEDASGDAFSALKNPPTRTIPDKAVNQKRLYCWNGLHYTRYYPRAGYAVVSADTQPPALSLLGPLSAGIVPWGYGDFQLAELLSRQPDAKEITQQNRTLVQLHFVNKNITPPLDNTLILDPEKNYAVLSFTMENEGGLIKNTYSDYTFHETDWVPHIVRIERLLKTPNASELISYEDWQLTQVSLTAPAESLFQIKTKDGTMVEMHQAGGQKSFLYHASDKKNISEILEEKLSLSSLPEDEPQNCATAAVRHLARHFSRTIPEDKIASLVMQETGQTSLFQVKQNLEEAGLYCMAVQTDLETLRSLIDHCTAIVHLPGFRHYVILDRIDQEAVWTIDLTSRKFYWKQSIRNFVQDWYEGTALLVSDQPTHLPVQMPTMDTTQLYNIQGGDFGTYSCSEMIQTDMPQTCPEPISGFLCGGAYYNFIERYGCIEDENGGTCIGYGMEGYHFSACINDPQKQGTCMLTGSWGTGWIRACK